MKKITTVLRLFLVCSAALFSTTLPAQSVSLQDSARHMLAYFQAGTNDKKIKAALAETESLFTGDIINDSLAAKLLNSETLLISSKKVSREKVLAYGSLLVQLFKDMEPAEAHPAYAGSLNGLGSIYERMGKVEKALPLYEQALDITRKTYGDRHPAYTNSLNNLAFLYQTSGDYGKALPLFQKVSSILKITLGEKSDAYITSLNRQAAVYELMGEVGKSREIYQQALSIKQRR